MRQDPFLKGSCGKYSMNRSFLQEFVQNLLFSEQFPLKTTRTKETVL